jgi:dihydrofolate reductase
MSKVFFSEVMSLDGFIAPEGMDLEHGDQPGYRDWLAKWMELQQWVFAQKFFRQNLSLGDGGETGQENTLLEETFRRTGVSIMGKRMFEGGEQFWPEEAPFHTPVFVLSHQPRAPWQRPGGTSSASISRRGWSMSSTSRLPRCFLAPACACSGMSTGARSRYSPSPRPPRRG